jgi:hypothetical protein
MKINRPTLIKAVRYFIFTSVIGLGFITIVTSGVDDTDSKDYLPLCTELHNKAIECDRIGMGHYNTNPEDCAYMMEHATVYTTYHCLLECDMDAPCEEWVVCFDECQEKDLP